MPQFAADGPGRMGRLGGLKSGGLPSKALVKARYTHPTTSPRTYVDNPAILVANTRATCPFTIHPPPPPPPLPPPHIALPGGAVAFLERIVRFGHRCSGTHTLPHDGDRGRHDSDGGERVGG